MAEGSGDLGHLVTPADWLARIARDPKHVYERQLVALHSSFDSLNLSGVSFGLRVGSAHFGAGLLCCGRKTSTVRDVRIKTVPNAPKAAANNTGKLSFRAE